MASQASQDSPSRVCCTSVVEYCCTDLQHGTGKGHPRAIASQSLHFNPKMTKFAERARRSNAAIATASKERGSSHCHFVRGVQQVRPLALALLQSSRDETVSCEENSHARSGCALRIVLELAYTMPPPRAKSRSLCKAMRGRLPLQQCMSAEAHGK